MSELKATGSPEWNFADPATHGRLKELREGLHSVLLRSSQSAEDKAIGYAWGRIDSPGYQWPKHGGDGLDFGTAYAIHYLSGKATEAIREAFEQWHRTGVIG